MSIEECIELMPKWLNLPLYMGGFPVAPDNYRFEGDTIREIYFRFAQGDNIKEYDENLLIAYVLYFMNAPIFKVPNSVSEKATNIKSFNELLELCLECGIDPF